MRGILCIPTFNECENIGRMIDAVHAVMPELHILVIDDGSPDGTARVVQQRQREDASLHLIEREGKLGLGTAYCRGFAYAIEQGFDLVYQMDADFSHDPQDLRRLAEEIEDHDLVIGSRYKSGVNVINWPMSRLLLSWFANLYTRVITGMPIADATGGFKVFRTDVLRQIDLAGIESNGYAFQIEMNYRAWRLGARISELPIVFTDRVSGESKMSKNIVWEAVFLVWKLKLTTIFTFGRK
jgi:dolichol-phosphate mannosyltransferase